MSYKICINTERWAKSRNPVTECNTPSRKPLNSISVDNSCDNSSECTHESTHAPCYCTLPEAHITSRSCKARGAHDACHRWHRRGRQLYPISCDEHFALPVVQKRTCRRQRMTKSDLIRNRRCMQAVTILDGTESLQKRNGLK
jgi:hypothetical protein